MHQAMAYIDNDYLAERYRALYTDPDYCVVPPIPSLLEEDPLLLPAADVKGKGGRPKKGPRKRARVQVNGEFHSSARHCMRVERLMTSDGAGAGASGSGLSQSGLSQSTPVDIS
ncbi:unnamed protein product [Pylaiella littoralis]